MEKLDYEVGRVFLDRAPPLTIFRFEKKVEFYNFGTLLRTDATGEYDQNNTMFVTRMHFYAVEIARNRLGINDKIWEKAQSERK